MAARDAKVSLRVERDLLASGVQVLCSVDEVGRGALSGPVTVGMVLIDATVRRSLPGVRDSKLLTAQARVDLVPRIRRWALACSTGHASAAEIDEVGIIAALRLAGRRALSALPVAPDAILLDGNHDWLSVPGQGQLFADEAGEDSPCAPVTTRIKADLTCASVAAASVIAKTERDALMTALSRRHPDYRWDENKGYATPEHLAAIRLHGSCVQHRRSWRLPDQDIAVGDV
jgi:ribonuclease HII